MSWDEVKRINSDLSTPLNEVLNEEQKCVYGIKTSRGNGGSVGANETFTNIVSVSGKGNLLNALVRIESYPGKSTSCLFRLTIDDEVRLYLKSTPDLSAGSTVTAYSTMGVVNLKSGTIDGTTFHPFQDMSNATSSSTYSSNLKNITIATDAARNDRKFIKFSSNLQEFTTSKLTLNQTHYLNRLVLMNKPLKFLGGH